MKSPYTPHVVHTVSGRRTSCFRNFAIPHVSVPDCGVFLARSRAALVVRNLD